MPGSIVTMCPAASVSVDSVERRGASCTSRPTPWPSPWPKFSPNPAAAIGSRASASASTPVSPAWMLVARVLLRLEADVVRLAQPLGQPAGRERARAVAAVAVDANAPVDGDERAAVDDLVVGRRVRPRAVRAPRRRSTRTTARRRRARAAARAAARRARARSGRSTSRRSAPRARGRRSSPRGRSSRPPRRP